MSLDINSPRGKITLADERKATNLVLAACPEFEFVSTDKMKPIVIDGLLVTKKTRIHYACVEIKCRYDCDIVKFFNSDDLDGYNGEWLITYSKVETAAQIATALCVPLLGFLYLVPSEIVLLQVLCDAHGEFQNVARQKVSETQATCNGGTALRTNIYFKMHDAVQFE